MEKIIKVENLSFKYNKEEVLKNISFEILPKEKLVLLGINGSGKSTLLKILNGLIFSKKGKYYYKDNLITESLLKDKEFARKFRKEVVFLFQNPDTMIFNPTVYDEIAFGLRQLRCENIDEKVKYWADKLGIYRYLKEPPFNLSGGEKQKVCLASLLVLEPEVILMDEPTSNLDPRSTGWFIDFLYELEVTTIISTHNLSLSLELGNRGIVLSQDHQIIYDGNLQLFLKDKEKLKKANLVHIHKNTLSTDYHSHDF